MDPQQYDKQQNMGRKARSRLSIDLSVKLDLSEDLQAIRRRAMDAQRYDVSKRALDLTKHETDQCINLDPSYINHATLTRTDTIHAAYECYTLPLNPPPTPMCYQHTDGSDASDLVDYLSSIFVFEVEMTVDAEKAADRHEHGTGCLTETDDFERDGYTLTRTIIRPIKSPVLGIFLQPSLCGLNCHSCDDAFEEDIDAISDLRKKGLKGEADIQVYVSEHRRVDIEVW